jgi:hypothetical protein
VFFVVVFKDSSHLVAFVEEGMSFSKPIRSSGGAGGSSYSAIHSQACKMVFSVYNFFKKI